MRLLLPPPYARMPGTFLPAVPLQSTVVLFVRPADAPHASLRPVQGRNGIAQDIRSGKQLSCTDFLHRGIGDMDVLSFTGSGATGRTDGSSGSSERPPWRSRRGARSVEPVGGA